MSVRTAPSRAGNPVLVQLDGHGHPALRATHAKTFEFSGDPDVGAGATCVLGVDARVRAPAYGLAGAVTITVAAGDHHVDVAAWADPSWRAGGAVVRRSAQRRPGTLATDADTTAADLPRGFAAALTDPDLAVSLAVRRRAGVGSVVLLRWPDVPGGFERLQAELAAADVVVTEDVHGVVPDTWTRQDSIGDTNYQRVLVISGDARPATTVPHLLGRPGVRVEVAGLPGELAVAAVSPHRGPLHLAGDVRVADVDRLIRQVAPDAALVVRCDGADAPAVAARSGRGTAALQDSGPWGWWGPVDDLPVRRGTVWLCLDPAPAAVGLDPGLLAAARSLRADGVATKVVAAAVAAGSDLSRSQAYDVVTGL